jgi:acid phosphatase
MDGRNRWAAVLPAVVGFGLGVGVTPTRYAPAQAPVGPTAPAAFKPEDPPNRGLDANLYMQTSGEYRACCLQAYNLATVRLDQAVAAVKVGDRKPAVVMDLDETVLDNAGFQAMQLRSGLAYDQRVWDIWEETGAGQVGLVPGAKEFIQHAGKNGVVVVYISNRSDRFRAQTKDALTRLGIPVADDDHLKLATTTSDKTQRRADAEKAYAVLLHVGDNLRDFDEQFRCGNLGNATPADLEAAIKERKDRVDAGRAAWGNKWVILPNPAYGEWTKPLGRGKWDLDRLAPPATAKP